MTNNPTAPIPTTRQWLDAFFASVDMAASTLADKSKVQQQFGGHVDPATSFSMDAYRERSSIWRKAYDALISFDLEDLEFEGASLGGYGVQRNDRGDFIVNDPAGIKLFREGEQVGYTIGHPVAQCVANFLSFYITSFQQGVDPRAYVKSILAQSGITKENFHQFSDKLVITNPWES